MVYDVNGNALTGASSGQVNNLFNDVFLIAHRGSSYYPENTLVALEKCVSEKGYKAVEFDFRFTSDDVCVALHDASINRTARNADGTSISETVNIASITYEQALNYDFGIYKDATYAGEQIPTLEQFLLLCKKKNIVAELDLADRGFTDARYESIFNTVKKCGMLNNTIFTIDKAKASKVALSDKVILCVSGRTSTSLIDEMDAFNVALGICSCPAESTSKTLAEYAHNKGYKLKAWTVNTQANINTNLGYGVDAMITDSYLPSAL